MYSPKIREDLIPRLYRLRVRLKRPMTRLVNEAVATYLEQNEEKENPCAPNEMTSRLNNPIQPDKS